jgi:hypothetical protein
VRAEVYRPPASDADSEEVVAVATWSGDDRIGIEVRDPSIAGLAEIVRPTPVVVDDASLRPQGTRGDVLLQPGDLEWFVAATRARAQALGLSVRFVSERTRGGWDPASQYRRFDEQVERLARDER